MTVLIPIQQAHEKKQRLGKNISEDSSTELKKLQVLNFIKTIAKSILLRLNLRKRGTPIMHVLSRYLEK